MMNESVMKRWATLGGLAVMLGVLLMGCTTGEPPAPPLEGTKWRLSQLNGGPVPASIAARPVDLQLDAAQHRLSGSSGVNRVAGSYQIAGKRISFGPLMGTRMAGQPEAMQFESAYLAALGRVDEWAYVDGHLELRAGPETVAVYLPMSGTALIVP